MLKACRRRVNCSMRWHCACGVVEDVLRREVLMYGVLDHLAAQQLSSKADPT